MKKYLVLSFCLLFASLAHAQFNTVTITTETGSTLTYTSDEFDSIRVLKNVDNGIKVYIQDDYSYDYLAQDISIQSEGDDPNDPNKNRNIKTAQDAAKYPEAWRLEYPHVKGDDMNLVIVKRTEDFGITYSLEWDCTKIANRWTCYQMHQGNMEKNVSRHDNFRPDPDIPTQYQSQLTDYSGSGFSRGHLCPSADRLCSTEQNSQTFFLSNMQPQWQTHNGSQWEKLEENVRKWADKCDTLYVVKAATIDNGLVYDEKCNGRLLVPKYFYMALLQYHKSTNTYSAVGMWTEHKNATESKTYRDYAISIKELEEKTGIDFFCNLPDDVEEVVESSFNISDWAI